MKRITLLLATLLATQIVFAQEEVAIEQRIEQRINKLEINPGWNVRLIHDTDSDYSVAIITNEALADFAYNVQLCNVKDQTMTILENTELPKGTVVEIQGPMTFESIHLKERATVEADRVVMPEKTSHHYLFLARESQLHIGQLQVNKTENAIFQVWERGTLAIDTIMGKSDLHVELYTGKFEHNVVLSEGNILISEFDKPTYPYHIKTAPRIIKTDLIDGQLITKEKRRIWDRSLAVNLSFGFRKGQTPTSFESAFTNNGIYSTTIGLTTDFRLKNRWKMYTGLNWQYDAHYMAHQVKLANGGLEIVDGQNPIQQNQLVANYLGVPLMFTYDFGKPTQFSLSFDVFFGRFFTGDLGTRDKSSDYKKWTMENANMLFNPWKLEVGIGFNTNMLGFLHGVRIYTNLLPVFSSDVTTDSFRSIGVEIKL